MKIYLFFYEGEEDGWNFEIEARDTDEAYEKAYDSWGPQVEGMYYRFDRLAKDDNPTK